MAGGKRTSAAKAASSPSQKLLHQIVAFPSSPHSYFFLEMDELRMNKSFTGLA
jgi:hypothetical protein